MNYMTPVVIRKEEELKVVATDMKRCATINPVPEEHEYSATVEEAKEKAAEVAPITWANGLNRIIIFHGHLITLCMTLDEFETPPSWHLSMGLLTTTGEPNRVPDKFTMPILHCFFGEEPFAEDQPEQAFRKVRHFLSSKKDAPNGTKTPTC
jgi:hypothetical protein